METLPAHESLPPQLVRFFDPHAHFEASSQCFQKSLFGYMADLNSDAPVRIVSEAACLC